MLQTFLRARLLGCALAALTSLAACKSSTPLGPPDASVLDTCSSDAECNPGFKCDREQRHCVCTGDKACPGRFCNAFTGTCVDSVPGCTSDSACARGEFCNRALRSCAPLTAVCGACRTDDQCGSGSKCAAHPDFAGAGTFCVPSCTAPDGGAGGCAIGLACRARDATQGAEKLCFPAQGACGLSNACTPDTLSICAADADCADQTQQCDTQLKACVAKNRVCPAGDACDPQQRVCAHGCADDSDCTQIEGGSGYRCRNNACFKLTTCTADAECASKQICQPNPDGSKSCKPGCVTQTDCPLGQGCNNDPQHARCSAGCTQNQDCPLNSICDQGSCKNQVGSCAQTCQTTSVCAIGSYCSSNHCCVADNLTQLCVALPVCTPCAACASCANPNCNFVFPKICSGTVDCAEFGAGTPCVTVAGQGSYCEVSRSMQSCTDDTQCPAKGFHCTAFGCGKVCLPIEQPAQRACALGHP